MIMYAITETSFRVVSDDMPLVSGEKRVESLPKTLIDRIKADQMRSERSLKLRSTDWTQMTDAPLTALEKTAYAVWRQALRDMTSLAGFPYVDWPVLVGVRQEQASNGPPEIEKLGD